MEPHPQLAQFLSPYSPHIQALTMELRHFVTELVPSANELIWDNYNAVALAYSKSEQLKDAFCHIAVYGKYVNFGFNRGTELTTLDMPLSGTGKLIRHLRVTDMNQFPQAGITQLMWEAVGISEAMNPALLDKQSIGKSMVMSIAEKKRRPS